MLVISVTWYAESPVLNYCLLNKRFPKVLIPTPDLPRSISLKGSGSFLNEEFGYAKFINRS